jgi:hypothetical protein
LMPFLMLNPPPGTVGKEVTASFIEPLFGGKM